MEIRKLVLYLALALVGIALWNAWNRDYPAQSASAPAPTNQTAPSSYAPSTYSPGAVSTIKDQTTSTVQQPDFGKTISVHTDVLNVQISLKGGNVVSANLPQYPVSLEKPNEPVQILNPDGNTLYISQSGITNTGSSDINYSSDQNEYNLAQGQNTLNVVLKGKTSNGLLITKTITLNRNDYAIQVNTQIQNKGNATWNGSVYHQIVRRNAASTDTGFTRGSYNGASYYTPDTPYSKLAYKDMDKTNLGVEVQGGWIAMQQHYFLSAWVAPRNTKNHYYSHVVPSDNGDTTHQIYTVGFVTPQITLAPNAVQTSTAQFYVGPEIASRLDKLAHALSLTIDYGWLSPISKIIFGVMTFIEKYIGNWGWAIVLVTFIIKLMFYPLSNKSYQSMAKMREVAPRMQALKERYGDDRQALSKATMEFYKKEKVNPMGGCLPMIVQIPVFFALYYVLIEAVQLRQAPWIFWIHDLSVKDPFYILPILMGASMLLQQKLSPPPADPTQAKMMLLMPVIFTVFFLSFPAGLVLYWLTNNVLSVAQQYYVMKTYDPKARPKHRKNKKR